jgi:hypothetical protein
MAKVQSRYANARLRATGYADIGRVHSADYPLHRDGDASLGEEIFDISVTEVELEVRPNNIADYVCGPPRCGNLCRL